jgi:hypothetical protein
LKVISGAADGNKRENRLPDSLSQRFKSLPLYKYNIVGQSSEPVTLFLIIEQSQQITRDILKFPVANIQENKDERSTCETTWHEKDASAG